MPKNKSGLAIILAIVPLVGLISLAASAVTGDRLARVLATGLIGWLALGAMLTAGYATVQNIIVGRKLSWPLARVATCGLGVLLMLR